MQSNKLAVASQFPHLQNNFISYLKAKGKTNSEIEQNLEKLELTLRQLDEDSAEYHAILFSLETCQSLTKDLKREERKQECYYLYKDLERTKMPRAEKIKTIANKLGVNTDCIQVYLREIFSS